MYPPGRLGHSWRGYGRGRRGAIGEHVAVAVASLEDGRGPVIEDGPRGPEPPRQRPSWPPGPVPILASVKAAPGADTGAVAPAPPRPCLEVSKTPAPAAGRAVSRNGQSAGARQHPARPRYRGWPARPVSAPTSPVSNRPGPDAGPYPRRQCVSRLPGPVHSRRPGAAFTGRISAPGEDGNWRDYRPAPGGLCQQPKRQHCRRKDQQACQNVVHCRPAPVSKTGGLASTSPSAPSGRMARAPMLAPSPARPRPITRPPAGYPRQPIRPARPNARPCADDWPRPRSPAPHTRPNGRPCEH